MTSKRIIYFIDNLSFGGTQTSLINLCRGLKQKNYQQSVICLNNSYSQDILNTLRELNVSVIIIGKIKLLLGIGFIQILFHIKQFNPDIIQTFLPYGDIIGRISSKLCGIKNCYSSIRARNTDKSKFWFFLDKITMNIAHKVIFNSKPVIEFSVNHEGVTQDQVIYIPNGINLPVTKESPLINWKIENQIPEETKIIGMIGRLSEQKGYDDAIKAFSILEKDLPNIILVIIGEGHLKDKLVKLTHSLQIEKKVFFLGTKKKAYSWLKDFDVFFLSSLWEGMPNVIMEAMYLEIPIVSTNIDSVKDLLDDKKAYLINPQDHNMMAKKLNIALSQIELNKEKVRLAKQEIDTNYSLEKMINDYDKLYSEN